MRVDAEPVVLPNSSGSMAHTLHGQGPLLPHRRYGRRERLASSRPAHRLDDDVEELAGFCKGTALGCGTGANPRKPVDSDLDPLDVAKPLKGVVHVDNQIAHHFDPRPGPSRHWVDQHPADAVVTRPPGRKTQ